MDVEVSLDEMINVNFLCDSSLDSGAFSGALEETKDVFDGKYGNIAFLRC